MSWTIITVTHNNYAELTHYWQTERPSGVRWIIVDNASQDDTVETARNLGAEVIALPKNVGFSAANNIGLREAKGEFIAFVNPDVDVVWTDLPALAKLLRAQNGLVAPQLLNSDGTLQPNGRGLPFVWDRLANRGLKTPWANLDRYVPELNAGVPTYTAWLTGAVICGRRSHFDETGGWDEDFFLYHEDAEICMRAWANDRPVILDGRLRWVHGWKRESARFRVTPVFRDIRSAVTFYRKWPELVRTTPASIERRLSNVVSKFADPRNSKLARLLKESTTDEA